MPGLHETHSHCRKCLSSSYRAEVGHPSSFPLYSSLLWPFWDKKGSLWPKVRFSGHGSLTQAWWGERGKGLLPNYSQFLRSASLIPKLNHNPLKADTKQLYLHGPFSVLPMCCVLKARNWIFNIKL